MIKFLIALIGLLVLSVIAGVIHKLRGGTFLPQPERDEDRLYIDKRGQWLRDDPKSGARVEALRLTPEERRANRRWFVRVVLFLLVGWVIILAAFFLMEDGR